MSKPQLNRIKAVLAEKNISSKDLAKHLRKTESTVSRWCTNEVQPSIETLDEIAKYLKIGIRELLVNNGNGNGHHNGNGNGHHNGNGNGG